MAYSNVPLNTQNPGCVVILVDQSWFMEESFGGETKAAQAALAVNHILNELVLACNSGVEIRDRCHVSVISYGTEVNLIIEGMISEVAALSEMRRIKDFKIDRSGRRIESEVEVPIWLEPQASKAIPMYEAFEHACEAVRLWISKWPDGFPPFVINITGRAPAYPELTKYEAERIRQLRTTDGNVLVFNTYLSSCGREAIFPESTTQYPEDRTAEFLFNISSSLPKPLLQYAKDSGISPQPNARCLVANSLPPIIALLNFESRVVSLRPNMLKLKTKSFITHKQAESMADCQDAYALNADAARYAIADGATRSFMPKPWAELLVKHFCDTTTPALTEQNWETWLSPIQKQWYQQVEELVKTLNLYYLTIPFSLRKAATATLIGLEIDTNSRTWQAVIIGDSCLFHSSNSGFKSYLIEASEEFTNRPQAFPSFEEANDQPPKLITGDVNPGDVFILATDALAKWVLRHKEAEKLEAARTSLESIETEKEFLEFVENARMDPDIRLTNDDVTLIQISVETDSFQ